ncbi:hypothetical protein VTK56DRAFT_2534 [Thermocarpiscus australiensis]
MATPNRPLIVGPASGPEPPYPLRMSGRVISGFGRGSKELGIPTANLPVDESRTPWISSTPSGVYFGWASLRLPPSHPDHLASADAPLPLPSSSPDQTIAQTEDDADDADEEERTRTRRERRRRGANGFAVYPMVMSIGYNPFYKNAVRSAEVHVLHRFAADFYGAEMRLLIAGFIREERDYSGLEALVADINFDCEVARRSLARAGWAPREVDVEVAGGGGGGSAGDGEDGERTGTTTTTTTIRGTLDCGWLIRPSEEGEEVEEGKN